MEQVQAKQRPKALLTMIGTIIGAGVFALPATFSQVGFWPGTILFLLVAGLIAAAHILFVDVILADQTKRRLAGYAAEVLGPIGGWVGKIAYPLQIVGANIAYIFLGGAFLGVLAQAAGIHLPDSIWQIVFLAGGAMTVLVGLSFVAKVESVGAWLLILAMLLVVAVTLHPLDPKLFLQANWRGFFWPFGVFLFALNGMTIVSETVEIVHRNRSSARWVVATGTVIAALVSWLFGVGLFFAAGGHVGRSPADLVPLLPTGFWWLIPCVGFLAVATSYVTTAQDLKATFHLDFKLSKRWAWVAAIFVPFFALLLVRSDFLSVIDFVGAFFGGTSGLLVALMALRLRRRKAERWLTFAPYVVAGGFVVAIGQKIIHTFWSL